MIHYQLRCSQQHEFDGWFPSSAAFDRQAGAGLVECPHCGDVKVARALMAPACLSNAALLGNQPSNSCCWLHRNW